MVSVLVSETLRGKAVTPADEGNTEKYVRWLKILDEMVEKGEFRNLTVSLSHLTAAGTVLEDPRVVYISEFLEWMVNNLRPALVAKKGRPEKEESALIVRESLSAAMSALQRPTENTRMHETFTALRYRATRLQLTKVGEPELRLSPGQLLLNNEDG